MAFIPQLKNDFVINHSEIGSQKCIYMNSS